MTRRSAWRWRAALSALAAMVPAVLALAPAEAQEAGAKPPAALATAVVEVPFYGNEACPMSGKPVDRDQYIEYEGQRVYFCCGRCKAKGQSAGADMVAQAYAKAKPVGNEQCPVSGRTIDPAKAKTMVFQGRELQLCCGGCEKKFRDHPRLSLTKALQPDLEDLDNKNCPMKADRVVDVDTLAIYDGKIVHFCCAGCIKKFAEAPGPALEGLP